MKDKRGNELQVGDTVFFKLPHNSGIEYGTVEGFTPKMVKLVYFDPDHSNPFHHNAPPHEVMIGTIQTKKYQWKLTGDDNIHHIINN